MLTIHPRTPFGTLGLLLALTACGGGGASMAVTDPAPPPPTATPAPPPAPSPAPVAPAGDAVRGRAIYQTICINCHAPNPDDDRRGLRRADASTILNAIRNVNQMRFLRDTIGPQEAADLEVWLANPV